MKQDDVRTRLAPSPTGLPHIGTLLQALIDYIIAKQNQGHFVLRIEDTDQKRFDPGAEEALYDALTWIGLNPDESPKVGGEYGPYRQSERLDLYRRHAQQLIDDGNAYICFCSPERLASVRQQQQQQGLPPRYDGYCRDLDRAEVKQRAQLEPHVVRLKVPRDQEIVVNDIVRGTIRFQSNEVDDQVLLKSDGFPTYHLAVVVDDHHMHISHVVRGEEWLSSAPKHVLLYDYFGWDQPRWFHTPTLRNQDKSKLSKRHGHTTVAWYQNQGFLSEALVNFLLSIIWTHPEQIDRFSLEEVIGLFAIESVHITGPIVDLDKLRWLNGQYIRSLSPSELLSRAHSFIPNDFPAQKATEIIALIQDRIEQLNQIEALTELFYRPIVIDTSQLLSRANDPKLIEQQLGETIAALESLPDWSTPAIENAIRTLETINQWSKKQYFMLIRYAVSGKRATPPLFEMISTLGKSQSLERLGAAKALVRN